MNRRLLIGLLALPFACSNSGSTTDTGTGGSSATGGKGGTTGTGGGSGGAPRNRRRQRGCDRHGRRQRGHDGHGRRQRGRDGHGRRQRGRDRHRRCGRRERDWGRNGDRRRGRRNGDRRRGRREGDRRHDGDRRRGRRGRHPQLRAAAPQRFGARRSLHRRRADADGGGEHGDRHHLRERDGDGERLRAAALPGGKRQHAGPGDRGDRERQRLRVQRLDRGEALDQVGRDGGGVERASLRPDQPARRDRNAGDRRHQSDHLPRCDDHGHRGHGEAHGARAQRRHRRRGIGLAGRPERHGEVGLDDVPVDVAESAVGADAARRARSSSRSAATSATAAATTVGWSASHRRGTVTAWATRAIAGGIWGSTGAASDGTSLFFATGNSKSSASAGPNSSSGDSNTDWTDWGDSETIFKFPTTLVSPADRVNARHDGFLRCRATGLRSR